MSKRSPNERLGYAEIKVNGMLFDLKDISYRLPGVRREDIDEGNSWYPVKEGGFIKGKAYLRAGDSVKDINKHDNATVLFTTNLGSSYTYANAWVKNNPEVSKDGFDIEIGVAYGDAEEKIGG